VIRRYRPVVWLHSYQQRAFVAHSLGSFSTVANALRAIEHHAKRNPIVTTNWCYHRDVSRAPSYDLFDARRNEYRHEIVDSWQPEPEIVPSVGELGWTP
jgi:hypothetical protein